MNLLKNTSKSQRITIFTILLLVVTSLWVYERHENSLENIRQGEAYQKLYEENRALEYEIKNLEEQNQLLNRVLELKQNLE